jgi:hypothetical protein
MKIVSMIFLSMVFTSVSYADLYTAEQCNKQREITAKQAAIAQTCAILLDKEFTNNKLNQANCWHNIDLFFEMLNELRKMEEKMFCTKQ